MKTKVSEGDTFDGSATFCVVVLSLRAAGNAPQLKHKKFAVERDRTISWVIQWLQKTLKCEEGESLVSQPASTSRDYRVT